MIRFNPEYTDMFLGVVRKYMQLRGGLSQKELAETVNIGISTMSRFLNQKTKELDPQLIASIIAKLNVPLHEIIDFVEEDSTEMFKKLVSFYKAEEKADEPEDVSDDNEIGAIEAGLDENTTRTKTKATIKGVNMSFGERRDQNASNLSIRDKLNRLSPRQKGFLTDFLDLDVEGRDLIVDVGNSLFRYFKQSSADF
ncbi:MAG: helix-turn-helix transcriptional regulator [Bacteriovoracaceae bacterium]|nr:helix-turn-helix transcriptional regulator [Bacteriovoracaceae bacterium]